MPLKYYDFYSFQDSVRVEMLGHLTFIIYLATQALCNRQAYVLCYQIFIFFFFFCFSFCKISSLGVYSDGLMVQLSCLLVLYIIFTLRQHKNFDKCNRFKMQHYYVGCYYVEPCALYNDGLILYWDFFLFTFTYI